MLAFLGAACGAFLSDRCQASKTHKGETCGLLKKKMWLMFFVKGILACRYFYVGFNRNVSKDLYIFAEQILSGYSR